MYRILLVDDDRDIVGALKIYLQNSDYELLCAYDGKQAVATVEQGIEDSRPVDLVLLDAMMPVMDGPAALVQIRKLSNVPVIWARMIMSPSPLYLQSYWHAYVAHCADTSGSVPPILRKRKLPQRLCLVVSNSMMPQKKLP